MGNWVIAGKCKAPLSLATTLKWKLWEGRGQGVELLLFLSLIFISKGTSWDVAYLSSRNSLFFLSDCLTIKFESKRRKNFSDFVHITCVTWPDMSMHVCKHTQMYCKWGEKLRLIKKIIKIDWVAEKSVTLKNGNYLESKWKVKKICIIFWHFIVIYITGCMRINLVSDVILAATNCTKQSTCKIEENFYI